MAFQRWESTNFELDNSIFKCCFISHGSYRVPAYNISCVGIRAVQQRLINRYSVINFSFRSADSLTDYSGNSGPFSRLSIKILK